MNKRYEEGRKPFFSNPGESERKQYVWTKDENGKEHLQETAPIDIQAEIESYADECDIKNIVRKASFDPEFLKSLSQGALTTEETPLVDITEFPQNIHEYHQMMATAQAKAMELAKLQEMAKTQPEQKTEVKEEKTE
nr:MAG TPA: Scaffold protein [Microviridae sp.]